MEVTSVAWHPKEKNIVLSCGLDGTIRIWDLLGECLFKNLVNKHVLRIVSKNGQVRIGATCCCYTPDGNKIIGGAADGSIHIWSVRKQYSRPDIVIRPSCYTINTKVRGVQEIADSIKGYAVTSITVSSDSRLLVSRNEDGIIRLWDLRRSQSQIETPLMEITGVHNIYPAANVDFSPDNKWLACGTSVDRNNPEQRSTLSLFQIPSIPAFSLGTQIPQPMQPSKKLVIGISGIKESISAICVKWQPNTNQIFCTTSSGCTKVFFDPRFSKKGALLTAGRAPPRPKDPVDEVIGTIYNPNSLPMFRNTEGMFGPKRGREYEKKLEAQKAKVPERPAKSGPGSKDNMSFFFTQHVMSGRAVDQSRGENPREALLKYDSMAKSDPIFFNKAYVDTQPAQILHSQTAEEEREDFKKKQRKSLDV
jgi:WD repeat-containing protein 70